MLEKGVRSWLKRPWTIFGLLIGGTVVILVSLFAWQVAVSYQLLRAGKDDVLTVTAKKRFESSVSSLFANATSTRADISQIESGDNPTLGDPRAPVHIVEYVDYGCPYTKQVQPVLDDFLTRHTNEIYFVLRDFPLTDLHPSALDAATAARCVYAQKQGDRFWRYMHFLYAAQDSQTMDNLRTYAQRFGAEMNAFDECVQQKEPALLIQHSLDQGVAAGVEGTPTFFFNGVKVQGAMDAQSLEIIFAEAKRRAQVQ